MRRLIIALLIFGVCCVSLVSAADLSTASIIDVKPGITDASTSKINLTNGYVTYTDKNSGASITSSIVIDGVAFTPELEKTEGSSLIWGTGEKSMLVIDDPTSKFTFDYDGAILKEKITLKEPKRITFPFKLGKDSKIIPWNEGEWKIVTGSEVTHGIVIEKPFGVDASGRHINMSYTNTGPELELVFDPLVEGEKPYTIQYPIVIDPTYNNNAAWVQVAVTLNSQLAINSLVVYNDGSGDAIYGGTFANSAGGRLYKYNQTLNNWSQVADTLNTQWGISSLLVYNDGTGDAIYGGTANISGGSGNGGRLFKYNGTTGGWVQVAAQLNSQHSIYALEKYDDGTGEAIFGGTGPQGRLFKYNSTTGGWVQVGVSGESFIPSMIVYNDGTGEAIYGGTGTNGYLFRYNQSVKNWTLVASTAVAQINSLTVYNDGTGDAIFGGNSGGRLFKWNATLGNWLQILLRLGSENNIASMVIYNDGTGEAIYGGTGTNGKLFKYNSSLTVWVQVAAQLNSQTKIPSLIIYNNGTGDKIYGGTYASSNGGRLFKWDTYTIIPIATFTSNVTSGIAPLPVQFNETSSSTGTSWIWNATNVTGNNTPFTFSTTQNPEYVFGIGNFSIKLNSTNAGGTNTSTQITFINVSAAAAGSTPVSSFTLNKNFIRFPNRLTATDTSTNTPTQWNYSWGDGTWTNGTTQNPTHQYLKRGWWTATLLSSNAFGSNTSTQVTKVRVYGYDDA